MTKRRRRTPAKKRLKSEAGNPLHIEIDGKLTREIVGIFYLVFVFLTFLGLQGSAGPVGDMWIGFLKNLVGIWGIYLFISVFSILAVLIFFLKEVPFNSARVAGLCLFFLGCLGLVQVDAGINQMTLAHITENGGYLGFIVGFLLYSAFSEASRYILWAVILIGAVLTLEYSIKEVISMLHDSARKRELESSVEDIFTKEMDTSLERGTLLTKDVIKAATEVFQKRNPVAKKDEFTVHTAKITPVFKDSNMNVMDAAAKLHKKKEKDMIDINATIDENFKWEFPSVDLLDDPDEEVHLDDGYLRDNAKKIEDKLEQFGVTVKVKDVKVGPTVMQYSLQPAEDVKLSKITSLRDDLKLALAAESLRIEAPIPGKSYVGIEMPNEKRSNVRLKELLLSDSFYSLKANLRIPLGKDVSGSPVIADLASMPHLLVAGQTGSGKSMGINTIIVSLLYQNSPRDLRLILVDPKRVELKVYNNIPHLLTPVITEVDKAVNALKWCVTEMMRRYNELESVGARNRAEYNAKVSPDKKMPHIVCIIDELAELMMTGDKKTIEGYICRIAQLARAVGMHLVVATQRPSVDVITGLIKANIPARIAYRVSSLVDSRTILDMIGAEDLLGKGDMLFMPGNGNDPKRIQGVFAPTEEVEKVVNAIKLTPSDMDDIHYVDEVVAPSEDSTLKGSIFEGQDMDEDSMLKEAIDVLRATGKASTSLLQRRLKIGYSRAARMLDDLEERGIVGPAEGSKPRKVFLDVTASEPAATEDDF
ncbi:MAG: DNA translocase FtsK [Candidatus Gracilibacteria bacterium]